MVQKFSRKQAYGGIYSPLTQRDVMKLDFYWNSEDMPFFEEYYLGDATGVHGMEVSEILSGAREMKIQYESALPDWTFRVGSHEDKRFNRERIAYMDYIIRKIHHWSKRFDPDIEERGYRMWAERFDPSLLD